MAIQKLLPNFIPESSYYYPDGGGNPYNGDRNQFYLGQFTLLTSSTYSGGVAQDNLSTPDSSSKSVNYIRKSISSPDDGTYVGLRDFTSGDYVSDYNRMIIVYDVPSVKVRGLTARLRYSGHPLVTPSGYLGYYVYDDNTDITGPGTGNNYRLIGNHVNVFPSSTGWSESSFATIEFPQFDSSNSGWIIDNDLLDNLIGSGSYIYLDMIFSPTGDQYASIQMNQNIGFSAFEIEVSGDISSKYLNMHTYSAPIQQSGAIDLYTKRHGYINSIEEVTVSGTQKLYPTNGTYANGSGAKFDFFPSDYLTYRTATGYNAGTTELITPAFSGDNPMVRYIREPANGSTYSASIDLNGSHVYSYGTVTYYNATFTPGGDYTNLLDTSDTTYMQLTGSDAYVCYPLSDMPVDFASMSSITITIRMSRGTNGDWASLDYVQILKSDGTTPITSTATAVAGSTFTTFNITPSSVYVTDKTSWNGAVLKIKQNYGTGTGISVAKVYLTITYNTTASANNISYIGLTNPVISQSGHSNMLYLGIGTQLDSLTDIPRSLQTNILYSGYLNPLDYNMSTFKSEYFLNLNNTSYSIGAAFINGVFEINGSDSAFVQVSTPKLYLDGTTQEYHSYLNISGNLIRNLIYSGATLSTYTTLTVLETWSSNDGYKNHGISAFSVDAAEVLYKEYVPHPPLFMQGSEGNSGNFNLSIPNVTIPINSGLPLYLSAKSGITNNFNLYTSGNNQINSGLTFAMPSPSFAIKDLPFITRGDFLTSVNMYVENGTFRSGNNNLTFTTYNNYTSGEVTKNINFHTSSQSGVEDNINMFIGGDGSFSGNTNLPMFINSFNQSGVDNISLFINNVLSSGNYGLDLYIWNTITESGNINLYMNGGGYGSNNNNISLYIENTPYNLDSGISLFLPNNAGSISSPSGNSRPGNIDFHTYSIANSSGNMNLSILGGRYGLSSGDINLYINSDMPSGNIDLSIHNTLDYLNKDINFNLISILDSSGDLTFSVKGGGIDLRQGELTLFTRSAIASSGLLDFSILGNTSRESVNLSIKVNDLNSINSGIPLSIFSAFNSGVFDSFTITTKARGYESSLPMYLPTSSTGNDNANIYMVMLNDTRSNKDVFLYIENNTQTNSANYTLFTQGDGTLKNGYVYNSSMNLFINRVNESVYNTIPMTLSGPSGIFESVPLVISGGYISASGIYLSLPKVREKVNKNIGLYSHGFLY